MEAKTDRQIPDDLKRALKDLALWLQPGEELHFRFQTAEKEGGPRRDNGIVVYRPSKFTLSRDAVVKIVEKADAQND